MSLGAPGRAGTFCTSCGTSCPEQARFCPSCGTASKRTISAAVAAEVPAEGPFCPSCGKRTVTGQCCMWCGVGLHERPSGPQLTCPGCAARMQAEARFCGACGNDLGTWFTASRGTVRVLARRYRLEREVGRGGMGVVFKAVDQRLEIPVAIKLVPPELVKAPRVVAALKKEAVTAMGLTHPNITRTHTFEEADGEAFVVMEWIEGQSLADLVGAKGPLDEATAIRHALAILDALAEAHAQRIIHRDLKPANVMVTPAGKVKLLDFGIARVLKDTMSRLSQGVGSSGTLLYMAPEQLRGDPETIQTDLYSFGAVLYELLAGTPPFHRGAVEHQILNVQPRPVESASAAVNAVLLRCLAKDPSKRFGSAAEVAAALADRGPAGLPKTAPGAAEPAATAAAASAREAAPGNAPAGEGSGERSGGAKQQMPARARRAWLIAAAVLGVALLGVAGVVVQRQLRSKAFAEAEGAAEKGDFKSALDRCSAAGPFCPEPKRARWIAEAYAQTAHEDAASAAARRDEEATLDAYERCRQPDLFWCAKDKDPAAKARTAYVKKRLEAAEAARGQSPEACRAELAKGLRRAPGDQGLARVECDVWTDPKAGLDFVRLPAGRFRHGCEPQDGSCSDNEKPGRPVEVASFLVGRTPVTVEAYRKCVQAKECRRQGTDGNCNVSPRKGRHPVNCVSFKQAQAFCAWVGGRLPTAAEWEYAAKGGESRIYPWGNQEPRTRACWSGDGNDRESRSWENTCPVDAHHEGVSKHGLFDMAGNVAQWVADRPDGGYEQRGGPWDTRDASQLRASARTLMGQDTKGAGDGSAGFRCAK